MREQRQEQEQPHHTYGGRPTLPSHLISRVDVEDVLYWSISYPHHPFSHAYALYSDTYGSYLSNPCRWPSLLCMRPLTCWCTLLGSYLIARTEVVLTSVSLEYFIYVQNSPCRVITRKSYPLDKIHTIHTTIKLTSQCVLHHCFEDLNRLIITQQAGPDGQQPPPLIIYGHENLTEFAQLIINTRNQLQSFSNSSFEECVVPEDELSASTFTPTPIKITPDERNPQADTTKYIPL